MSNMKIGTYYDPKCIMLSCIGGLAWRIIMGSGFHDWGYWHFFTITVNCKSSHIELLLDAVWRTCHWLERPLSHELMNPWRSRSLPPATSRHALTWHRDPLEPMAIYLFNVKTFVVFFFSFRWASLLIKEGLVFYIYRLVFAYYT
jgi:hypothetical protein